MISPLFLIRVEKSGSFSHRRTWNEKQPRWAKSAFENEPPSRVAMSHLPSCCLDGQEDSLPGNESIMFG